MTEMEIDASEGNMTLGNNSGNPWTQERLERLDLAKRRLSYGISFIDEATGGIAPNDVVVIGADTGVGKTEIAALIASQVARQGKHVTLYALEAAQYEIHSRIKYQRIAEFFFAYRERYPPEIRLNYHDWALGKFDEELYELEIAVADQLSRELSELEIITPTVSDFTAEDMSQLTREWGNADLVILDHLHYLSWKDNSEYDGLRHAVAHLRDFVNQQQIPLILLSHLRKSDKKSDTLIPTKEDLHGSSEISKRANLVITFARGRKAKNSLGVERDLSPGSTFVRIGKARLAADGCENIAALLNFDLSTHLYRDEYFPFLVDRWATHLEPIASHNQRPWMKKAKEFM